MWGRPSLDKTNHLLCLSKTVWIFQQWKHLKEKSYYKLNGCFVFSWSVTSLFTVKTFGKVLPLRANTCSEQQKVIKREKKNKVINWRPLSTDIFSCFWSAVISVRKCLGAAIRMTKMYCGSNFEIILQQLIFSIFTHKVLFMIKSANTFSVLQVHLYSNIQQPCNKSSVCEIYNALCRTQCGVNFVSNPTESTK